MQNTTCLSFSGFDFIRTSGGSAVRYEVSINAESCKACGLCIANCRRHVLARGTQLNSMGYEATAVVSNNCSGCGMCYYTCPEPEAIVLRPVGIESLALADVS